MSETAMLRSNTRQLEFNSPVPNRQRRYQQSPIRSAATLKKSPQLQQQHLQLQQQQQQQQQQQHVELAPLIVLQPKSLTPVPLTKEMFLEAYGKGKWNLSVVARPECLSNTSLLKAPESYYEIKRLKAVDYYMKLPHWKNTSRFVALLQKAMEMFQCKGASISLVGSKLQTVKHEINLGIKQCARSISLDAHAILSSRFFAVLDASSDWRTENNPLVVGQPSIRYYLAVPLLTQNKEAIGILAIFDPFPRVKLDEDTVQVLKQMASEVMDYFDKSYPHSLTGKKTSKTGKAKLSKSSNGTADLLKEYGRATSIDTPSSIVFESDGSGSSYQQNQLLRFSRFNAPLGDLIDLGVWRRLLACKNSKIAAQMLCSTLIESIGYNCVYVMNLRITELFRIESQYFPAENEIDIENYKCKSGLEGSGEENINMRVIAIQGVDGNNYNFPPTFHYKAFKSDFGLLYDSSDRRAAFQSGICMPFHKEPSKLVRKKRLPKHQQQRQQQNDNDKIELYHRSSGFLIACFNKGPRELNEREIGYTYSCASILRRLYLMNN